MSIYYLIQYIIILPIYYLTQGETWSADCSSLGPACHQVPSQVDYLRIDDSIFIVTISIVIIIIVLIVLIMMIRRAQAEPHPRKQLENRHGWRLTIQTDGYVKGDLAIAMYIVHIHHVHHHHHHSDRWICQRCQNYHSYDHDYKIHFPDIHLHSRDTRAMASFGSS